MSSLYELIKDIVNSPESAGRKGEKSIANKFNNLNLSGYEGTIIRNAYIPKSNGSTTEIDVLFVTKKGIFVIESKNYGGWIFGDEKDDHWTVSFVNGKKYSFYNPILQNENHIKWLRSYLGAPVPMCSIVVFSDRAEFKKLVYNTDACRVIHQRELLFTIKNMWDRNPDIFEEHQVKVITDCLQKLTDGDFVTKVNHLAEVQKAKEYTKNNMVCPLCGKKLVLRTARNGSNAGKEFYGCQGYPNCHYTRNKE